MHLCCCGQAPHVWQQYLSDRALRLWFARAGTTMVLIASTPDCSHAGTERCLDIRCISIHIAPVHLYAFCVMFTHARHRHWSLIMEAHALLNMGKACASTACATALLLPLERHSSAAYCRALCFNCVQWVYDSLAHSKLLFISRTIAVCLVLRIEGFFLFLSFGHVALHKGFC